MQIHGTILSVGGKKEETSGTGERPVEQWAYETQLSIWVRKQTRTSDQDSIILKLWKGMLSSQLVNENVK